MDKITRETDSNRKILPQSALENIRLGISVSSSADLARLGLMETHFRLALGEIARCVLVSGGQLTYGGHLDPEGYTVFLLQELHRYSRRDRPLQICLAWQEHRKLSLSKLKKHEDSVGLFGDITYLDVDGNSIDPFQGRSEEPVLEIKEEIRKRSLTSLRTYMAHETDGRIFIGGKREGFQGEMPGLVEEAILALKAGQPIYLAGGFGGVTMDIVRALEVDDGAWFPQSTNGSASNDRLVRSLSRISNLSKKTNWNGLKNGLTDDENRKLATTYRPSEIATLISFGLGKRFARSDCG